MRKLQVFVFYFFIALVICWPAFPYLHSRLLGGSSLDAGLYIYLCNSALSSLINQPWFTTNAFYPYGLGLAWSDNFILPATVFQILKLFFRSELAYNILILSAISLNSCAFFSLAKKLNVPDYMAHFFALTTSCFAYFTSQLGHPQILFFFFVPTALKLLIDFFYSPNLKTIFFLVVTILCCFLTTVYYSVFIVLLATIFGVATLLTRPKFTWPKNSSVYLICLLLMLTLLFIFVLPYLQVKDIFGARFLYEADAFALKPSALVNPSNISLLYSSFSIGDPENQFFPGIALIILTALGLIHLPGNKKLLCCHWGMLLLFVISSCWSDIIPNYLEVAIRYALLLSTLPIFIFKRLNPSINNKSVLLPYILLFCAALFLILASGPVEVSGKLFFDPFVLLFKYFPGIEALRAVARYALLALSIYYLLAIWSLSHLTIKKSVLFGALLIIAVENLPAKVPIEEEIKAPSILNNLPSSKRGVIEAIIALPMATRFDKLRQPASWSEYSRLNVNYMNWLANSNYYLVNGYSGQRTKIIKEFPEKLGQFPDERSVNALRHVAGLRYILYNSAEDPKFSKLNFTKKLAQFSSELTLLAQEDTYYLFELNSFIPDLQQIYLLFPAYFDLAAHLSLFTNCLPNTTSRFVVSDAASSYSEEFRLNINETTKVILNLASNQKNQLSPKKISFSYSDKCKVKLTSISLIRK